MSEEYFSIRIKKVTDTLGTVTIFLALACFTRLFIQYNVSKTQYPPILELFNMDADKNIPIFFYITLLILCSLLLLSISILKAQQKSPQSNSWLILTFIFLVLSLEKAVRFQEYFFSPIKQFLTNEQTSIIKYFPFIIVILIALGLIYYSLIFIQKLPANNKRSFIIATCIYLSGAIILDLVGSAFYDPGGLHNLTYNILGVVEESVEMIGIIIFINTFLNIIRGEFTPLIILVDD
jgi:hypothetical protein